MILPEFEYCAPETIEEVFELLNDKGAGAKVLAGGTDLLVKMKHGLIKPQLLVSLKKIKQLKGIRRDSNQGIVIGATTTHNELVFSQLLNETFPSVAAAARQIGANQIRNLGTIGGNLCNAVPSADLPPILIALGANVKVISRSGERVIPVEKFFVGPNQTVLAQDELLTEIIIPVQGFTGSAYLKFGLRRSGALAVVGIAVAVRMEGDVCADVRIALGAVAPTPIRAFEAENVLRGQKVSDDLFERAGQYAAAASRPISDHRASAEYRRHLVGVLTKRALAKAISGEVR